MTKEPDMTNRVLEQFFRARWTEQTRSVISTDLPLPSVGVSAEETSALIRLVSERETQEAIRSLAGDKAPGPDGFPPVFFRRYFTLARQDVIEAIQQFFSTAAMSPDWQRTFVTLIFKRQGLTEPGHYCPISLCTTLNGHLFEGRGLPPRIVMNRAMSQAAKVFLMNFDSGMAMDRASGGVGFVIRDQYSRLIAAGGWSIPRLTVVGAELRVAWEGIRYARCVLVLIDCALRETLPR
ncbi:uncharacterized protein LOC120105400 [Phoenix dactylifera]|uniref:Uncharacterized protein LOC120105400 n=1 Tax=Phoenix dactylifera TaxID=42345 RepID=A0A8B8ZHU9_PHODC|nr:uncharacterized protein LOC120105400 [Phoenix dactylifera]